MHLILPEVYLVMTRPSIRLCICLEKKCDFKNIFVIILYMCVIFRLMHVTVCVQVKGQPYRMISPFPPLVLEIELRHMW